MVSLLRSKILNIGSFGIIRACYGGTEHQLKNSDDDIVCGVEKRHRAIQRFEIY